MILFVAWRNGRASRSRIQAIIEEDPGIHVTDLVARTGLSWHTVAYHLTILERGKLVYVEKDQRERRAFPVGLPSVHRQWLAAMRVDQAREVLRMLLDEPLQSVPALSRRMGYSEKVIRRQMANLADAGLVERHGTLRPVYQLEPRAVREMPGFLRRRLDEDAVDGSGSEAEPGRL